ncbi:hypothetical protein BX661DRAFT_186563, partial [Kickxella alabastrina]|uniref:uncharacterized protein n=1 Tax=Kickxella alabastrina TaxID=61397 RepID=UPI00221F5E78
MITFLTLIPFLLGITNAFNINSYITQMSAHIQLNSTSSPINTEWTGIGWDTGSISIQKLSDNQLVALFQLHAPTNDSTVRAGRATEFSTAYFIDEPQKQGMYLQSKIDKDNSASSGYSLSIKEEVAKALEEAAKMDDRDPTTQAESTSSAIAAEPEPLGEFAVPASRNPLGRTKPPETLATCEINRDSQGKIKPICKFLRQLPIVPSFPHPFSSLRRTAGGNVKFERAGIFKDLAMKGRLANVIDITAARCVSHGRMEGDLASCQRDPNNPEFYVAIDGIALNGEEKERGED